MRLYKITAIVASIFSVIFSFSILLELQKFVEFYVFLMSGSFLVLFIIYNEISKVRELQKRFRQQKSNLTALITTITVSFGMSLIGILFWTNSTYDEQIKLSNDVAKQELIIDQKYQILFDSIAKVTTPEYEQILIDLKFWKERRSDSKVQRDEILQNIRFLEAKKIEMGNYINSQRNAQKTMYSEVKNQELSLLKVHENNSNKKMDKNNLLSLIFFTIVLVSELMIIYIQKQIVNMFDDNQRHIINIVKDCELRNLKTIPLNEFKFNRFNQYSREFKEKTNTDEMWETTKKDYNILVEVGILDSEYNLVKSSKEIENYFDKTNKF